MLFMWFGKQFRECCIALDHSCTVLKHWWNQLLQKSRRDFLIPSCNKSLYKIFFGGRLLWLSSGDCLGHCSNMMPHGTNQFCTTFALWHGPLSSWWRNLPSEIFLSPREAFLFQLLWCVLQRPSLVPRIETVQQQCLICTFSLTIIGCFTVTQTLWTKFLMQTSLHMLPCLIFINNK